jgi:hypothetical protein
MAGKTVQPIDVVADRIYAGVINKPRLFDDVQGPESIADNGKTGGPISQEGFTNQVLQNLFRGDRILLKFVQGEVVDETVPIAVAGDFMAPSIYFPDQGGITLRHPPEDKEGGLGLMGLQEVQAALDLRNHPGFQGFPLLHGNERLKPGGMEPFFYIDGEDISNWLFLTHNYPSETLSPAQFA